MCLRRPARARIRAFKRQESGIRKRNPEVRRPEKNLGHMQLKTYPKELCHSPGLVLGAPHKPTEAVTS